MSTDSNLGVNAMRRHEEYYIRDGTVCFLVENISFRLHRYFFERESDFFRDLFSSSSEGEDGSLLHPYQIHDVKSEEFADFVWIWYKPRYTYSKQSKEKWLTILRLATKWGFGEIRELAVQHFEKMNLSPIEKITMYRKYSVDSKLLFPSYVSLCTSPTLPSPEEAEALKLKTVLKLASARERVILRASELGSKTPTVASAPEDIVKAIVAELFDLAVHSNEQNVRVDGQTLNNSNASRDGPADPEVITVKEPVPGKKGNEQVSGVNGVTTHENPGRQDRTGASANRGRNKH